MTTAYRALFPAFLSIAISLVASRAATLMVGDPAPKLEVGGWVQGEAVASFEKGKPYIVEFWATWCGPCRVSIPHLNELHQKFKERGLIVIGQDIWEEDTSGVKPFVRKMGDKMTYRVALDKVAEDGKGVMALTWMEAAGQEGIPTAFVVNQQGKVAWIGHPMELKDDFVEEVVSGKHDLTKAIAAYAKARELETKKKELSREYETRAEAADWKGAEAALNELAAISSEDDRDDVELRRLSVLLDQKDFKRARALGSRLSESKKDEPMVQNSIAWDFATAEGAGAADLDLAEKIVSRGKEQAVRSDGQNAEILDTLARIHFLKDRKEQAIAAEEAAIKLAKADRKKKFESNLASFRAGKLPPDGQIRALRSQIGQQRRGRNGTRSKLVSMIWRSFIPRLNALISSTRSSIITSPEKPMRRPGTWRGKSEKSMRRTLIFSTRSPGISRLAAILQSAI